MPGPTKTIQPAEKAAHRNFREIDDVICLISGPQGAKSAQFAARGRLAGALAINQTISYHLYATVRGRKPICGEIERGTAARRRRPTRASGMAGEKTKMSVAKAKPNKSARRRSGRPTKEQAGRITEHIVEVATRLFLESSFEAISVDLIAATARISKQTFYARFASKEALFAAVIRKGVNDLLMPAVAESSRDGPIEATLVRIGVELSKRSPPKRINSRSWRSPTTRTRFTPAA
jgi:hypothetical protein